MRPRNRHRSRVHLNDAVLICALPPLVLSSAGLRPAAPVRDAEPPSPLLGRVSSPHFQWPVQSHPTPPSPRARAHQLSRGFPGALRLPTRTSASLLDHRVAASRC